MPDPRRPAPAIACRAAPRSCVAARGPRALVLASLALAAGLWCGAPRVRAQAPAPVPAAGFHLGGIDFSPCEIGRPRSNGVAGVIAQCARIPVPEDPDHPAGRQVSLRVALVRSEAEPAEPDVVAFLDGGPGQAATEDYPALQGEFARIRRRHHILLVDQRGTGGSNPLFCPPPDETGAAPAGVSAATLRARRLRQCLARLREHASVEFYATQDAVRDLDAVRRALGVRQLDLVGVSYGTQVAQAYAKTHPEAVRAIVLDSPVPVAHALTSEHASNLEDALRATFARCARQPGCAERFGDPYQSLRALHRDLTAHPRTVRLADPRSGRTLERRLGADELASLVRIYAYSPHSRALLPLLVDEARQGDAAPLLANAEMLEDALGGLVEDGMSLSAAVVCTEDFDRMAGEPTQADTLLGTQFFQFARETCPLWPHRPYDPAFARPLRGDIPTLVLSGEFDPVTPPRYGEAIVRELSRARQLVLAGQGHSVMGTGCAPRLVAQFLDRLDPAALDAGCLQVLGDVPFFLDRNGAAP